MPAHVMLNTALRKVATIDLTPDDPAVIIAPAPEPPHDEAWLINTAAPLDLIVAECNGALALMEERRDAEQARHAALRARGQRRALWLLLAAFAGLLLPSPSGASTRRTRASWPPLTWPAWSRSPCSSSSPYGST